MRREVFCVFGFVFYREVNLKFKRSKGKIFGIVIIRFRLYYIKGLLYIYFNNMFKK